MTGGEGKWSAFSLPHQARDGRGHFQASLPVCGHAPSVLDFLRCAVGTPDRNLMIGRRLDLTRILMSD